jgi:hypothetical protein
MVNLEKYFEIYDKIDDFLVDVEVPEKLTVAIVDDEVYENSYCISS